MEADHKEHIANVKRSIIESRIQAALSYSMSPTWSPHSHTLCISFVQMEKKASAKREAEQRRLEERSITIPHPTNDL